MALVKAPSGVKLRLEIEALKDDRIVESRHWVEGTSDGDIVALQGATGHIYLKDSAYRDWGQKCWRWEGIDGKTEKDMRAPEENKPRTATKLVLRLIALNPPAETQIEFALFAFPETGGFFTAMEGKQTTKQTKVRIGGKEFDIGDLKSGEVREVKLSELAGGERIELNCSGSKLALVELIGETNGLMCHALRKVSKEGEKFVLGELTEQGQAFAFYGWDKDIGVTCLWHFEKGLWEVR